MSEKTPVQQAAEAMEDAAFRLTGRDLGTIYRDRIAEEALTAAVEDREGLAAVIRDHHWSAAVGGCNPAGSCQWWGEDAPNEEDRHALHVADAIARWLTGGGA